MSPFLLTLGIFAAAFTLLGFAILSAELSMWLEDAFGLPLVVSAAVTFVLPMFLGMWVLVSYIY